MAGAYALHFQEQEMRIARGAVNLSAEEILPVALFQQFSGHKLVLKASIK